MSNTPLPFDSQPFMSKLELMVVLMKDFIESWEAHALKHGAPLDAAQLADARALGVREPERVRVLYVPNIPLPPSPILRQALIETQIINPQAFGLCVRYGILLRTVCRHQRYWLAHELAHTAQFERVGDIEQTMNYYLRACLTQGYENSWLEQEAEASVNRLLNQVET